MSTFTLAISNLPRFMDLTCQVPMQYCSLQHRTWLILPVRSTMDLIGVVGWVLLLLWLHPFILSGVLSPLITSSMWAPTDLGSSSFSILSFSLFVLFIPCPRPGAAAKRSYSMFKVRRGGCGRYPLSKVKSSGCALLEQP